MNNRCHNSREIDFINVEYLFTAKRKQYRNYFRPINVKYYYLVVLNFNVNHVVIWSYFKWNNITHSAVHYFIVNTL